MLRFPLAGRSRSPFATLALALLAALALGALWSQDASAASGCSATTNLKTWKTAAASGDWNTASNWTPSGVPGSSSNVCIPAGASTDPTASANVTVASVEARSPLTITAGAFKATTFLAATTVTVQGGALSVTNA